MTSRNEIIEECKKALEPANHPLLRAAVVALSALKDAAPQAAAVTPQGQPDHLIPAVAAPSAPSAEQFLRTNEPRECPACWGNGYTAGDSETDKVPCGICAETGKVLPYSAPSSARLTDEELVELYADASADHFKDCHGCGGGAHKAGLRAVNAAGSPISSVSEKAQESWWLIENNKMASVPYYFTGAGWTKDPQHAARFISEADANMVRGMVGAQYEVDSHQRDELFGARGIEHGFIYHMPEAPPSATRAPQGMVRDAERYRWLRSEDTATNPKFYGFWKDFRAKLCREDAMDALIDMAMSRADRSREA